MIFGGRGVKLIIFGVKSWATVLGLSE